MSMNLTQADIDALIEQAESQLELESVIGTRDLASKILSRKTIPSRPLPWKWTEGKFELRPGEVTIWAGDNGSGKSLLVGQAIAWLMLQGQKALIASMEMRPEETVGRICDQTAGCKASDGWVRSFCDWAEGRLWLYDRLDTVASDHVLAMIRAVTMHLGVQHVVIDSLVKCGIAQDGNGHLTAQTGFVDSLQHLAKHLDIHVHLIAHMRKPEREGARATKHDIRGASQITDLADNVVLLSRNRAKEAALAKQAHGAMLTDAERAEIDNAADTWMTIAKQRHFSYEGVFGLNYRADCGQFVSFGDAKALYWPEPWGKKPVEQKHQEHDDGAYFNEFI